MKFNGGVPVMSPAERAAVLQLLPSDLELLLREINEFCNSNPTTQEIPKLLEDYLHYVAQTGNTVFPWTTVKPLFRYKIASSLNQFSGPPGTEDEQTVYNRFDLFRAAPFTIQRLTELINNPTHHYKLKEKYLFALEKTVFVVSTVEPFDINNPMANGSQPESEPHTNGEEKSELEDPIEIETTTDNDSIKDTTESQDNGSVENEEMEEVVLDKSELVVGSGESLNTNSMANGNLPIPYSNGPGEEISNPEEIDTKVVTTTSDTDIKIINEPKEEAPSEMNSSNEEMVVDVVDDAVSEESTFVASTVEPFEANNLEKDEMKPSDILKEDPEEIQVQIDETIANEKEPSETVPTESEQEVIDENMAVDVEEPVPTTVESPQPQSNMEPNSTPTVTKYHCHPLLCSKPRSMGNRSEKFFY